MMAQVLGGFVLWIVFTGGNLPGPDVRPRAQYNDMATCLRMAEAYRSDPNVKQMTERLRDEFFIGTTFLCLPTGARP